jgi:hypothetical protein
MIYSPIFWPFGRTIIAFPQPTVVKAIFFYGRCGAADGWGWSFMEGGEEGNLVGIWSRYERG